MSHVPDPEDQSRDEVAPPQYDVDEGETGGTADPSAKFREMEIPPEQVEEIEKERAERLDPANRPAGAEVDNTQRTFDPERGDFVD